MDILKWRQFHLISEFDITQRFSFNIDVYFSTYQHIKMVEDLQPKYTELQSKSQ